MKAETTEAIRAFRKMQVETVLLTRDLEPTAQGIADYLCVDRVETELFPDDKPWKISALRRAGKKVAVIGDGTGHAAALAAGNIGIAMGCGIEGRQTANLTLPDCNLMAIVELFRIARQTRSTIITNFVGTALVTAVGVGLASTGILEPIMAALLSVTSELLFLFNSARLLGPPRSNVSR
jgi:P-type Cu+ transporter